MKRWCSGQRSSNKRTPTRSTRNCWPRPHWSLHLEIPLHAISPSEALPLKLDLARKSQLRIQGKPVYINKRKNISDIVDLFFVLLLPLLSLTYFVIYIISCI